MEKSNNQTTVVLIIGVFLLLIGLAWRIQDKTVENSPIFKNRKESTTKESTQKESDKTFKSGAGGVTGAGTKFRNAPSDQFNKIIVSNAAGDMNTIDRNNITATSLNLTGSAVVNGDMTHNGHTIFNGQTSFKGNAIGQTHFPYTADGRNYIRGETQIDGKTNINGQLCIGDECIDGNHLRMLTKGVLIKTGWGGHYVGAYVHTGDKDLHAVGPQYKTHYKFEAVPDDLFNLSKL
jgi:hypothetical protein